MLFIHVNIWGILKAFLGQEMCSKINKIQYFTNLCPQMNIVE